MTTGLSLPKAGAVGLALASVLPAAVFSAAGARRGAMRAWCRVAGWALGLHVVLRGVAPPGGCLIVSNHVGYLDPLVLGQALPSTFVAKSEIAGWPGIGAIARLGGTVFVRRESPRAAARLLEELATGLARGRRFIVFPEAQVSVDGRTLAPFRAMLFEAALRAGRPVVPTALRYVSPADPRVWAWVEEPNLVRHLRSRVLPAGRIEVEVVVSEPLWPEPGEGRKALAHRAREAVARSLFEVSR